MNTEKLSRVQHQTRFVLLAHAVELEARSSRTWPQNTKDQINEVAFSWSGSHLFVPTGAGTVVAYDFSRGEDQIRLEPFRIADPHACVINCCGESWSWLLAISILTSCWVTDMDPRGRCASDDINAQRNARLILSHDRYIALGASDSVVSLVSLRGFYCHATLSFLELVEPFLPVIVAILTTALQVGGAKYWLLS